MNIFDRLRKTIHLAVINYLIAWSDSVVDRAHKRIAKVKNKLTGLYMKQQTLEQELSK